MWDNAFRNVVTRLEQECGVVHALADERPVDKWHGKIVAPGATVCAVDGVTLVSPHILGLSKIERE
ncbi:MAG: hypothetical protein JW384_00124 [Nitrosomonadaceae bacterium]|nr:hypothetical protein [Nitrosomonadaceae bacterium]